jgi:hypothetical protein
VTRYMSDFGKVKSCNNDCGTLIYFDAQSTIGHPSPDRWVPLEYIDNVKTNQPHQCSKRSNGSSNSSSFSKQQHQAQEATDVILQVKLLHQKIDTLIEMLGQKLKESKS